MSVPMVPSDDLNVDDDDTEITVDGLNETTARGPRTGSWQGSGDGVSSG